jgi:shikimate dehydrogenase
LASGLAQALADHDVVIQGTPIGMYPRGMDDTVVPKDLLRPEHIVFDMVYRPLKTRLIREAEAAGCRTILGMEMLLYQAALQFELWTGVAAPIDVMRQALVRGVTEDSSAGADADR